MSRMGAILTGIRAAGRIVQSVASVVMTPRCRSCGLPLLLHDKPFLCEKCLEKIEWIGPGACTGCGYPAGQYTEHAERCYRCRDGRMGLTGAIAVTRYSRGAKELVQLLKFRGEQELAAPLGHAMTTRLRAAPFFGTPDIVVPVPLHPRRQRERGYNQSVLLARIVSRETGIPLDATVLTRIRETEPQARLSREARLANLDGAFVARPAAAERRVLLVDDVMTTGATMAACSRALRDAGAVRVYAVVFAR